MTYTVKLTNYAVSQLMGIADYISKTLRAPDTADKWMARLQKQIESLDTLPNRVPLVEAEPWGTEGVHKMRFENFLIYFWVDEAALTVWVTAVVYARADQLSALKLMPMD